MSKSKIKKALKISFILTCILISIQIIVCAVLYLGMRKSCNEDYTLVSPTGNYIAEIDNSYYGLWWKTISDVTVKNPEGVPIIELNGVCGTHFYWSKNTDNFWMYSHDIGAYAYLIENGEYTKYHIEYIDKKIYLVGKSEKFEYNFSEIPDDIVDHLND